MLADFCITTAGIRRDETQLIAQTKTGDWRLKTRNRKPHQNYRGYRSKKAILAPET
jgi:hypothetical protein